MSLSAWMVTAQWTSVAKLYRPADWDIETLLLVQGCDAIPCRRKTTSNFDQPHSFAGQSNQDSMLTSDELRMPVGYDVRGGDVLRLDGADWFVVAGDPKVKSIIPRQVTFITVTTPPKIGSGYWGA
jgi:hypothetical protein